MLYYKKEVALQFTNARNERNIYGETSYKETNSKTL